MLGRSVTWVLMVVVVLVTLGGAVPIVHAQEGQQYLAYNVWYEKPKEVSSTNYLEGAFLPAGTKVQVLRLHGKKIQFVAVDLKQEFTIHWVPKHRPGVSFGQFYARLFKSSNFEEFTRDMTADEVIAIKRGEVVNGMSKRAVLLAYGFPPEVGTASLQADSWRYWFTRFNTKALKFADDRVIEIVD